MKKILLVSMIGLLSFATYTFAGCGACGGDHSHSKAEHNHDKLEHGKKACCSVKTKDCDSSSYKAKNNYKTLTAPKTVKNKKEVDLIMKRYHKELRALNKKYKKKLKKYQ
tara:strand:+ start:2287 stop:2616 length:330 start_codon:yes stop_codon:yes gene_type:complete